jgi:hypothetical protein
MTHVYTITAGEKTEGERGRGYRWSGGNPFAAEREELLQKKIFEHLFECLIELVRLLHELEGNAPAVSLNAESRIPRQNSRTLCPLLSG